MKKVLVLGTVLSSMLFLGACKAKEEVAPTPIVTQQLYPTPTVKISLDLHVLASSEAARTSGLDGAVVTVKQNGVTYGPYTTDESGIITIGGLTEGDVSYFVKKSGYASYNGSTNLQYTGTPVVDGTNGNTTTNGSVTSSNEQLSSVVENVTLSRIGASVSGVVIGDLDGGIVNNVAIASGTIILTLDNTNLEPNTYTATVSGGVYTFTNLPENQDFTLSTQDIKSTIAASGSTPQYNLNLNFSNADADGTTPKVGNILYKGPATLND